MPLRFRTLFSTTLWVLVLTGSLFGCKDSTEPPVATTVSISGGATSFSAVGQAAAFTAQVLDKKGNPMRDAPVTWSSSAPQVLEINPSSGLATARGNGTAVVRAASGSASATRDVTVAQVPQNFSTVAGNAQVGTVGDPLPVALRIRALDSGGSPVSGSQVAFAVSKGGGSLAASSATTDASGEASTQWTLGTTAAEAQEVTATLGNLSAVFTSTANPGPPALMRAAAGDAQTGYAMEPLGDSLAVQVTDRFQNPTPSILVSWAVTGGGGSLSSSSGLTDAAGMLRAVWTMGTTAGENTASASVQGLPPLSLTATARPNGIITGTVTVVSQYLAPSQTEVAIQAPASAPRVQATVPEPQAVPGELLVVFREAPLGAPALGSTAYNSASVSKQVEEAIAATLGAHTTSQPFEVQAISPAGMAAKIRVANEGSVDEVAAALRMDPRVKAVEPNYFVYGPPPPESPASPWSPASSEPFYPFQAWHYEMIGLPDAWEITTGSPSVTVAVVDDGIRFDHWDLAANLTSDGYDFVEDIPIPICSGGWVSSSGDGDGPDPDPTTPIRYSYNSYLGCVTGIENIGGHGTHVAGTIGAVGNNGGLTGVNWTVRMRPVRVLGTTGSGNTWSIAQGILYAAGLPASTGAGTVQATYPAHVINLSLGGPNYSSVQASAITAATGAGSLIVASAGNDGVSTPNYPAAYPEVMAVSAVDPWFGLSIFSNYGSWIDIAAPGGFRGSDFTSKVVSTLWNFRDSRPSWDGWSGTSMAAPHVSGVAALIFAANPEITAAQVKQRLLAYANPAGPSNLFGAGIVHAFSSLTNGMGWPRALYVRLVDAATGRAIATVPAGADRSFRFSRLEDGHYLLFAGLDERNDGQIGVPGRRWGAHGGSATPTPLMVTGGGVYEASFSMGAPIEQEPNDTQAQADYLALGGYVNGSLGSVTDQDWFAVQVPETATYTFGTHGWTGACGMAAQANTALALFDSGGTLLASNDDINAEHFDFCSGITHSLPPGVYFLRVTGSISNSYRGADQARGYYRVTARKSG